MRQVSLRRFRLASQVLFFGVFLLLVVRTEFAGSLRATTAQRLPYPVSLFLEIDPLVALSTALSTGALYRRLAWSLVILVPTFAFGRFFCGWACPLGTLNHFFGSWKSDRKRGAKLIASNRYRSWQAAKYYTLAAALVLAILGSAVAILLDPISLIVRSFALVVLPGVHSTVGAVTGWLYASPLPGARIAADVVQFGASHTVVGFRQPHFQQVAALGLIFAVILFFNLRVTRFWCRALCPLGALLGVASRWSLLRLQKDPAQCDSCNRCLLRCQGGDDPIPGASWRKAECHLCFNCVGDCPQHALQFAFVTAPPHALPAASPTPAGGRSRAANRPDPRSPIPTPSPDLSAPSTPAAQPSGAAGRPDPRSPIPRPSPDFVAAPQIHRRKLLGSLALGAGLLPVVRGAGIFPAEPDPRLIRPPGSLAEARFLERCIRCGECMKVCPTNALQPSLTEAGVEGLWTPLLVPRVGYCEPECVLCGQACPTGAIWEISGEEKTGRSPGNREPGEPVKIGTAFYDRGRCLPWAMGTECLVCEEWCPTSPKAIYLAAGEVVTSSGEVKRVRQPYVDPKRCTGCGACEYACPVHDRPAVYVTSIGESRSKSNQILLERGQRAGRPRPGSST